MPGGEGISDAATKSLRDYARELKAEVEEEAARLVKEKGIPEWDALIIAGDTIRARRNERPCERAGR
jgi:hypothetical protein